MLNTLTAATRHMGEHQSSSPFAYKLAVLTFYKQLSDRCGNAQFIAGLALILSFVFQGYFVNGKSTLALLVVQLDVLSRCELLVVL